MASESVSGHGALPSMGLAGMAKSTEDVSEATSVMEKDSRADLWHMFSTAFEMMDRYADDEIPEDPPEEFLRRVGCLPQPQPEHDDDVMMEVNGFWAPRRIWMSVPQTPSPSKRCADVDVDVFHIPQTPPRAIQAPHMPQTPHVSGPRTPPELLDPGCIVPTTPPELLGALTLFQCDGGCRFQCVQCGKVMMLGGCRGMNQPYTPLCTPPRSPSHPPPLTPSPRTPSLSDREPSHSPVWGELRMITPPRPDGPRRNRLVTDQSDTPKTKRQRL